MPRGRTRVYTLCRTIAAEVADGHSYPAIAARHGISRQLVAKRLDTMRLWLAEHTGDGRWVNKRARTAVQVGRTYVEFEGPGD